MQVKKDEGTNVFKEPGLIQILTDNNICNTSPFISLRMIIFYMEKNYFKTFNKYNPGRSRSFCCLFKKMDLYLPSNHFVEQIKFLRGNG